MPRDTIERAIKKATGAGGGEDYAEVRYEGYGPAGVAIIVEALTDNRNRTASDVRSAFTKHGGALGETNSVASCSTRLGVIRYSAAAASADDMLEAAIEAGADERGERRRGRTRSPARSTISSPCATRWRARFGPPESAKLDWRPATTVTLGRGARGGAAEAARRARRERRRAERLREFRHPRRGDAEALRLAIARELGRGRELVRLLGVDPGLRYTGWGVIEADGNRLRHLADGVIATDGDAAVPDRLKALHDALAALLGAAPAGRGGDRGDLREPQRRRDPEARLCARRRAARAGAGRHPGRRIRAPRR